MDATLNQINSNPSVAGPIDFSFTNPLTSFSLEVSTNNGGLYTVTAKALGPGMTLLDTEIVTATAIGVPGTVPIITVTGSDITSLVITSTNDSSGILIAEGITPLPAALPLFATGLGALGLLGWRRKRKARAAAA
jgi:hypothetical protein